MRIEILLNIRTMMTAWVIFVSIALDVRGQSTVVNSSFEDNASDASIPKGWFGCELGTTPDILPGFWGEYGEAAHGDTYVGLITRENSTFESIGQRLSQPLTEKECHRFSIQLAHGKVYAGYNNPIKLRIWIGNSKCDKDQLIYESPTITNKDWKKFVIEFVPKQSFQYILFEAFYKEGKFAYKGNVLLDQFTPIVRCGRV